MDGVETNRDCDRCNDCLSRSIPTDPNNAPGLFAAPASQPEISILSNAKFILQFPLESADNQWDENNQGLAKIAGPP